MVDGKAVRTPRSVGLRAIECSATRPTGHFGPIGSASKCRAARTLPKLDATWMEAIPFLK